MAEHTRQSEEAMRSKHPSALGPSTFTPVAPVQDTPQLQFGLQEVEKAALSFRRGSAPGPGGFRPEHLRITIKGAPANRAVRAGAALTRVVNLMAAGRVPEEVAPYLCGARLHALLKKDGGLRPIAVGNLLRRLTSKLIATALADKAADLFAPHQLGVGVRGGCEAILHTVRQALEKSPEKWVLQGDFINAFNLASRDTTFREVEKVFPEALAWVLTSYGAPSNLQYGDSTISSERGFHQGDPLAGLLFSANLQPVVETIEEEVPDLEVNAWFLDDGDQVGTPDQLRQVVDILLREGPPRGLILSTSATVEAPARPKTTVWCPTNLVSTPEDPLERGLLRVREPGIILLGAPLGSPEFIREALKHKMEKVREITSLLPFIEDPHTEFVLLRSCLALPKLMFSLRTVDTTDHQEPLQEYDRITREALTRIMGSPLQDLQWSQATLPTSMGGLGLRSAVEHAPGAYVASYTSSQPLLKSLLALPEETPSLPLPPTSLNLFSELMGEEATTESLEGCGQKFLSLQVDLAAAARLADVTARLGSLREQARLASLSLPYAGTWLNVVPSPALGLHLRGPEFITAIKYRLGADIFRSAGPCPA